MGDSEAKMEPEVAHNETGQKNARPKNFIYAHIALPIFLCAFATFITNSLVVNINLYAGTISALFMAAAWVRFGPHTWIQKGFLSSFLSMVLFVQAFLGIVFSILKLIKN